MIVPVRFEAGEARGPSFLRVEFEDPDPGSKSASHGRKNLVFVIMAFGAGAADETYAAIQDECARQGLKAVRVDDNVTSGLIIKDILQLIEGAEFIVCDLTHERPNVYYELGYAHGVGNNPSNIFLTAREGTHLHFDIAPLRVHYYRSNEHLRSIMATSFAKLVAARRRKTRGSPRPRGGSSVPDDDL